MSAELFKNPIQKSARVLPSGIFIILFALSLLLSEPVDKAIYAFDNGHSSIEVFYNPEDAIIFQDYDANYPQVDFVIVTYLTKDSPFVGLRKFYTGPGSRTFNFSNLTDRIAIVDSPGIVRYQLYNLSAQGFTLSGLEHIKDHGGDATNKTIESFFKVLWPEDVDSLEQALNDVIVSNGAMSSDLPNDIPFFIDDPQTGNPVSGHPEFLQGEALKLEDIMLTKDNPYCVIAVVTWNTQTSVSNLNLAVRDDEALNKIIDKVPIELSRDNIQLYRENVEIRNPHGTPLLDEKFRGGDPGEFVIAGITGFEGAGLTSKRYDNIIRLKIAQARDQIDVYDFLDHEADGPDWAQVAAADLYNQNLDNGIFNSVWSINAVIGDDDGVWGGDNPFVFNTIHGQVSLMAPYCVRIKHNEKTMRLNLPWNSAYQFRTFRTRDHLLWHEAVHCFAHNEYSRGVFIFDEEEPDDGSSLDGDLLYVNAQGGMSPLFQYSYDHKDRGFVNAPLHKKDLLRYHVMSDTTTWGDDVKWAPERGYYNPDDPDQVVERGFIVRRLDDELTSAELDALFAGQPIDKRIALEFFPVPSLTPDSLPSIRPQVDGVWIYARSHGEDFYLRLSGVGGNNDIRLVRRSPQQHRRTNGVVYLNRYDIAFEGFDTGCALQVYRYWLEQDNSGLYAIFSVDYDYAPEEYDACIYGNSQEYDPIE